MSAPKVSVITPVYNGEQYIERLLHSVLGQTHQNIQWILVNDASSDNSAQALDAIHDSRVTVVHQPKNGGVAAARNTGLKYVDGDYVCFLDCDDWWSDSKIQAQVDAMENNQWQLSYMDYVEVGAELESPAHTKVKCRKEADYASMLKTNSIGNLTAMVRADAVADIEFNAIGHEDYLFWLQVMKKVQRAYKVNTPTPLCFYQLSDNSLSADKYKAARWQWSIYREYLGLSWFASFSNFIFYMQNGIKKFLKRQWAHLF